MFNCVIIDDEITSRMALREALKDHINEVTIVEEANSVAAAITKINEIKPNLVFLDIELGDGTGFDVIEHTQWNQYHVIFITAYNQYAIKAFRNNAVDYLLKPINADHLNEALSKAAAILEKESLQKIQQLLEEVKNTKPNNRIGFPTSDGFNFYDIAQIVRCESSSNYCTIFFYGEEKLLLAKTLKELEEAFLVHGFQRVHQSHLVNMQYVKKYTAKDGGGLILSDGVFIPVSHRKKGYIMEVLQNLSI